MSMSLGVELVWNLAAQEAIAAGRAEIEEEHFLCALMKYSELADSQLAQATSNPDAVALLLAERDRLRVTCETLSLPTTQFRHRLRAAIEKGQVQYQGGIVHRSAGARDAFSRALQRAQSVSGVVETSLLLQVLLETPSATVQSVLGSLKVPTDGSASPDAGLLAENAVDIMEAAGDGPQTIVEAAGPQLKVLNGLLQHDSASLVALACAPDYPAVSVLQQLSRDIEMKLLWVGLPALCEGSDPVGAPAEVVATILAEGASREEVLVLDARGLAGKTLEGVGEPFHDIGFTLSTSLILILDDSCCVDPVAMSRSGLDYFHVVWLRDLSERTIPATL